MKVRHRPAQRNLWLRNGGAADEPAADVQYGASYECGDAGTTGKEQPESKRNLERTEGVEEHFGG